MSRKGNFEKGLNFFQNTFFKVFEFYLQIFINASPIKNSKQIQLVVKSPRTTCWRAASKSRHSRPRFLLWSGQRLFWSGQGLFFSWLGRDFFLSGQGFLVDRGLFLSGQQLFFSGVGLFLEWLDWHHIFTINVLLSIYLKEHFCRLPKN